MLHASDGMLKPFCSLYVQVAAVELVHNKSLSRVVLQQIVRAFHCVVCCYLYFF